MSTVPFFSVIMPVYGVETYLRAAVDSVLAQTYADFELILVDDCSPDSCPQICDDYAQRDARVRVIHKPQNQGLGMARNSGMAQARGEYVLFVDSDDFLDAKTLHCVFETLDAQTDVVVFGMKRMYERSDGTQRHVEELFCEPCVSNTPVENGEVFVKLNHAHLFPFVCNKAYRRAFLQQQNAMFETTKLIEDFLFNIALFETARSIRVIKPCLYTYRKPAHRTLVNSYSPEFYELTKRKYRLERAFLQTIGATSFEAVQTVLYSHVKHIISVFLRNSVPEAALTRREQLAEIRAILSDDVTVQVLREFHPQGVVQTAVALLLRSRMAWACYGVVVLANLLQKR